MFLYNLAEFAVTTNQYMTFYDADWTQVASAAHEFKDLSAITYDEMTETIYFNAKKHENGSIFSLKFSEDSTKTPLLDTVVHRANHECIESMTFDSLERILYWTDSCNHKIYQKSIGDQDQKTNATTEAVWLNLTQENRPMGITIDVCRRNVYWTNWATKLGINSTVSRARINPADPEDILTNGGKPMGVAVDQFSKRLFWVDDLQGDDFVISSSALDGTDRQNVVSGTGNDPVNLAVDQKFVYWTDKINRAIWRANKKGINSKPEKVPHNFTQTPNGIILRSSLISAGANNADCSSTIATIKARTKQIREVTAIAVPATPFCLNPKNGKNGLQGNACECAPGFEGKYCEIHVCINFCMHGSCNVDSLANPICTCPPGYEGSRCERKVCDGYCLNDGLCELTEGDSKPFCKCDKSFYGQRCEHKELSEVCREWCQTKVDLVGHDLVKLCGK